MVPVAVDVHNLTDASWSRWRSGHAIAQAGGCTTQGSQPQARKRQHLWLRKECNRLSAHVAFITVGSYAESAVTLVVQHRGRSLLWSRKDGDTVSRLASTLGRSPTAL